MSEGKKAESERDKRQEELSKQLEEAEKAKSASEEQRMKATLPPPAPTAPIGACLTDASLSYTSVGDGSLLGDDFSLGNDGKHLLLLKLLALSQVFHNGIIYETLAK